jgi:hypothetical protein
MNFLKTHIELILGSGALVLVAAIAAVYVWGVGGLIRHFGTANDPAGAAAGSVEFRLEEADQILRERGIFGR